MATFYFDTSTSANYYFDVVSQSCDNLANGKYITNASIATSGNFYWKKGGNRSYDLSLLMKVGSNAYQTYRTISVSKSDSSTATISGSATAAVAEICRNISGSALACHARLHESQSTTLGRITGSASGKSGSFGVANIVKLTAVTAVTLTKSSTTGQATVTWTGGGADAMANKWSKYEIVLSVNKSTMHKTGSITTASTRTITFTGITPGNYYAGVRCVGTAGNTYASDYVWSSLVALIWNTAPGAPSILYPAAASLTTYDSKPWFLFKTGTDAEGNKMSLSYKIDSGSWTACGSNLGNSTNGTLVRWGTALSAGSHTVYVKASDGSLESSTTSRAFTYTAPTLAALSAGDSIDDGTWNKLDTMGKAQNKWFKNADGTSYAVSAGNSVDDATYTNLKTKISNLPSNQASASTVSAGTSVTATQFNNLRTAIINS